MKSAAFLALGAVVALSALMMSCEVSAKGITFDSVAPGCLPSGWTSVPDEAPKWKILRDSTAPSPPNVLAQVSRSPSGDLLPLAIFQTQNIADGSVGVKFKPVDGKPERVGGVVWRYRDPKNYYLARANALENNVAVFKVLDGKQFPLVPKGKAAESAVARKVPSREWSTLKVKFRGPRFVVYFNHRELLRVEDGSFAGPGKVGLLTQAGSVTYFDDFRAEARR